MAFVIPDILTEDQAEQLKFWPKRFGQHAFFLSQLLNKKSKLQPVAKELARDYDQFLRRGNLRKLPKLVARLSKLQTGARDRQIAAILKNKLEGCFMPAWVNHMEKELQFFLCWFDTKTPTPMEELKFWSEESAEHTQLIGQLVNGGSPSSNQYIYGAVSTAHELAAESLQMEHKVQPKIQPEVQGLVGHGSPGISYQSLTASPFPSPSVFKSAQMPAQMPAHMQNPAHMQKQMAHMSALSTQMPAMTQMPAQTQAHQPMDSMQEQKQIQSTISSMEEADRLTREILSKVQSKQLIALNLSPAAIEHELAEASFGKMRLTKLGFICPE